MNLSTLLLGAVTAWLVARTGATLSGQLAAALSGIGAIVAGFSTLQLWLRDREARERREFEELQNSANTAALFNAKPENLRASRARKHFERFLIPSLTALLCMAEGFLVWRFYRQLANAPSPIAAKTMLVLAWFSLQALLFFVLGKYAAGLAQHEGRRLARPAASYLLLGAMLSALVAGAAAANYVNVPPTDLWLARGLVALLALVTVETAMNLVLEIYRPRVKGKEAQPVYESRVLGLLSQPEGLLRTAAQTLDYQFGFKVSETWFYRYLQQAIAGLFVVQLLLIWLSSTLVILEPHEQALLERFGRPVAARAVLGPGLHFKWPWPVDRVHVYPTAEVRGFSVGFVPDPKLELENTLLWTRVHYKEEANLLVASREAGEGATNEMEQAVPVNLLTVSIPVQYRITNLLTWARSHSAGERFLPLLATREVTRYLVSVDPEEVMASGRQRAAAELRDLIQLQANAQSLGVEILFVGLQDVHPPVQIADAYEAVVSATQERETRVLNAEAYRAEVLPHARADGERRLLEQQGRAAARVAKAEAQAARFQSQSAAFHAAPSVYCNWNYHETLTAGLALPRKFILATTNSHGQFWLNFEEKLRTDLLDVPVPVPGRK
ncbi:MAG: protease modulator HflK [Verrucomicrobiae bacterium]|nr:protease modulator HflK [Verrucomicrobiae bacterium]